MEEDEIYIATKVFLAKRGWVMLAGQPPNGCNHLPVVEIKLPGRQGIGSRGAYKPDLIAAKQNVFLLIECKPAYNQGDADKLNTILGNADRMDALFAELTQRHIFERHKMAISQNVFRENTLGALAYGESPGQKADAPNSIRDPGLTTGIYSNSKTGSDATTSKIIEIQISRPYDNSEFKSPQALPAHFENILRP
jgi:hypothetical protein